MAELPAHARRSTEVRLSGAASLDDLSPAWAWGGATGRGVRVAIIDSGVEADHPALGGSVDAERSVVVSVGDDGVVAVERGPHGDEVGHGTACAGIVHRLAPDARIVSVKVLGPRLSGSSQAFLAGLRWAVDEGIEVVNLSLGTRRRDWALAFYELCDEAYFRDTFVVTAANNVTFPTYPSLYASVASVACNLSRDPFRFHYNPEPPTEFLAPGVDVEIAWRHGTTITGTGNSYAAPHLAGIAALVRSKHPQLRPFQIKTVLWATAANVREAPNPAGRLSAVRRTLRSSALRALQAGGPEGRPAV